MQNQSVTLYSRKELHQVALTDEIVPFYQPIIDTRTNSMVGLEVLLRWHQPDGNEIPPDRFIPVFTHCGLINHLTQSLLRKVLADFNNINFYTQPFDLHINFSALHIQGDEFVHDCLTFLAASKMHNFSLVVEITEADLITNMHFFKINMNRLRVAGVRFYIDDFGTGYANLNLLSELKVYGLKIDRTFTQRISSDPLSALIVQNIINIATYCNIEVIAEEIEENHQMHSLKELNIFFQQGFLFSKPVNIDGLVPLLRKC
ncbi:EAL domain-containing protein [Pantoea agglomerans]|uniref:EAL domain-containing protein n=1 Tax=Enterobacter agglomerans TaxID=549 RepID=UPI003C7DA58A